MEQFSIEEAILQAMCLLKIDRELRALGLNDTQSEDVLKLILEFRYLKLFESKGW